MKCNLTYIVKTESTSHHVTLTVQPEGTDEGYDKITIQVIPQKEGVLLHFSGLESKIVIHEPSAGNQANLTYKDEKLWHKQNQKR